MQQAKNGSKFSQPDQISVLKNLQMTSYLIIKTELSSKIRDKAKIMCSHYSYATLYYRFYSGDLGNKKK